MNDLFSFSSNIEISLEWMKGKKAQQRSNNGITKGLECACPVLPFDHEVGIICNVEA